MRTKLMMIGTLAAALAGAASADVVQVRVTIENLAAAGGVAISPVTLIAHNGGFDAFNAGSAAGLGTQTVAESGNGGPLGSSALSFQSSAVVGVATATQGGFGPGIYLPGGRGSIVLTLDTSANRYLSYGAMVVPSNDYFIGNDNPMAVELFDVNGSFTAQNFTLTGGSVWDAGTELDQLFGSAFIAGQSGGDRVSQNGVVTLGADFSRYIGLNTPAGYVFTGGPGAADPLVRFSFEVVPTPGTAVIAGLGGLLATRRRR